jgi:hypothetical protein
VFLDKPRSIQIASRKRSTSSSERRTISESGVPVLLLLPIISIFLVAQSFAAMPMLVPTLPADC